MQDAIFWPPVPRVSVVVRLEGNSSEIRARNDRTTANMSDEGLEGAQLQAQTPQARCGKIWGRNNPKRQDGAPPPGSERKILSMMMRRTMRGT